jgi:osmotically-inducible protein OsmY
MHHIISPGPEAPSEELARAAADVLRASGYLSLRGVRCEVIAGVVVLRGTVPSYFLKQAAQAAVARLHAVKAVTNLIEVNAPPSGRRKGDQP